MIKRMGNAIMHCPSFSILGEFASSAYTELNFGVIIFILRTSKGRFLKMKTLVAESFSEYIEIVNSLPFEYCLSRGQSGEYPLLPSALRKDPAGNRLYSKHTVDAFLEDFENEAVHFIDKPIISTTAWEWQVYAQHFGLPTRLLDFTYSHTISLMFAVENAFSFKEDDAENAVVWFLNPYKLNEKSSKNREIINISSKKWEDFKLEDLPVAISAKKINSRIAAQNGLFVAFTDENGPLESLPFSDDILIKVLIPKKSAKGILRTLYLMGMRHSSLYPELSSVSKDIVLKENVRQYIQNMEDNDE